MGFEPTTRCVDSRMFISLRGQGFSLRHVPSIFIGRNVTVVRYRGDDLEVKVNGVKCTAYKVKYDAAGFPESSSVIGED